MSKLRKEKKLTERELHLLEMADGLRHDWLKVLIAADRGPRACRREVRRYSTAHVATICEIANVVQGGKIGEYITKPEEKKNGAPV